MTLDLGFVPPFKEQAEFSYINRNVYPIISNDYLYIKNSGNLSNSAYDLRVKSGQLLDFDGVDDYISTDGYLLTDTDEATIALTFVITEIPTETNVLVNFSPNNGISIFIMNEGYLRIVWYRGGAHWWTLTNPLSTATYYRLVFSCSNDEDYPAYLYLNNSLIYSKYDYSYFTYLTNEKLLIGSLDETPSLLFNGLMSDVQVWNKAFDADDVDWDYNNRWTGKTAAERAGTSLSLSNLKARYLMIEHAYNKVYDWSGNSHHGTLINFPIDDTQWKNFDNMSNLMLPQTALIDYRVAKDAIIPLDINQINISAVDYIDVTDYDIPINLSEGNIINGTVVVSNFSSVYFTENTDFTIDYTNGTITVLSTGSMALDLHTIEYDYSCSTLYFEHTNNSPIYSKNIFMFGGDFPDITSILFEFYFKIHVNTKFPKSYLFKSETVDLYFLSNVIIPAFCLYFSDDSNSVYTLDPGTGTIEDGTVVHGVIGYSKLYEDVYGYINGIESVDTKPTLPDPIVDLKSSTFFDFCNDSGTYPLLGPLHLFKIYINDTVDKIIENGVEDWVTYKYQEAQKRFNL